MDGRRTRRAPRAPMVHARTRATRPEATGVEASDGEALVLAGVAVCGACGTTLAGQAQPPDRLYACEVGGGGCGIVRVAAGPLEDLVAARVLAVMTAPQAQVRLVELGQTSGLDALTAEAFTHWWRDADGPHRHAMIVLLLDRIRVAPALGGRLAPVDVRRVTFLWR
ncbi:hypothetical protein PS9374_07053 [Planomonospora sphaerica]|uniref:Recombinase zinc beta ribbon domain-containing protein n=1 Tax=Planomonospora sphaerica TaxID=161355 RepID=A0A171DQM1_9ACTN|nr:zinc ribbon domain-containing protein [Planomonospora sphaerica]GAT71362.1 hypothetical protein PS9374_07053 [Planomonospora sphaerica]